MPVPPEPVAPPEWTPSYWDMRFTQMVERYENFCMDKLAQGEGIFELEKPISLISDAKPFLVKQALFTTMLP